MKGGRDFQAGTSTDLQTFKDTFGEKVGEGDLLCLEAMARIAGKDSLWAEIVKAVEKCGTIRVWGEW